MYNQQQHIMQLETIYASGAEEWNCPTCGRRLLMNWEPKFKKIILEAGNEYAIHSGGKGGLRIGRTQIIQMTDPDLEAESMAPIEDERLAPWEAWLKESDFENRWNDEDE